MNALYQNNKLIFYLINFQGEPIKLECIVQSIPKAASVVWRRNSQLIEADNKYGYELITEPLPDTHSMVRHLLVIRNAKFIDFGQFNCTATNELGEDSILITLIRQSKFLKKFINNFSKDHFE